jgi:cellulose synthase (UDP-forming)
VVIVGIRRDSSPPALFMAALASLSAWALLYVSIVAQQVTMQRIGHGLSGMRAILPSLRPIGRIAAAMYHGVLRQMREGWLLPAAVVLATVAACSTFLVHAHTASEESTSVQSKDVDTGGFYTGIDLGDLNDAGRLSHVAELEKRSNFQFRIVALHQGWGDANPFPAETLKQLRRQGAVPVLNWLPTLDPATRRGKVGPLDRAILRSIRDGRYDNYVRQFADETRAFGEPVLITFAPQADNPQMPWSRSGGNTPDEFVAAWRHIVTIFNTEGAANAGWVWSPATAPTSAEESSPYFPGQAGKGYVDWIGVSNANDDANSSAFVDWYRPFHVSVGGWHLPILLTNFSPPSGAGPDWLQNATSDMARWYPEIKGVVFKDGVQLAGQLDRKPFSEGAARPPAPDQPLWFDLHPQSHPLTSIVGGPGHFNLMVDGRPFYIKGMAYNPGHDWRDADIPLTRTELDEDFSAIQKMGGNTIRRYGTNWSDRNILNAAADHHLKVLYGFWFLQDIDCLTDEKQKRAYQEEIEATVLKYRDHPGILGWGLGSEVWGLLKHQYGKPYLTEVRHAHVLFVEQMARRIKELDPNHPVFSVQESEQISDAVSDYAVGAPSLDFIGVNSFYQDDIANLDDNIERIDRSRPYLVSEFGPTAYWDTSQNQYDRQHGLIEDTALSKATLYADRWREYIQADSGRNIGGVAYCWSDRYEGTSTWFGMTDLERHPKPSMAALANAWQFSSAVLGGNFPYNGPKILNVDYPTTPQLPNHPLTVKANVDLHGDDHARFVWTVTGPGFKADAGRVTPINGGTSAAIELPSIPGWYRIELKVLGRSGLDEANVPVLVQAAQQKKQTEPARTTER